MIPTIIVLVIVATIVVYFISTYNRLVTIKGRIQASIQEIGNQLKRQASLIPNLQESAKAFLQQEKGIFETLANARKAVDEAITSGDLNLMNQASNLVSKALEGLRVVVESNPEIKSDQVISQLMNELRDTADKVMYARRTLIDLTADYNIMIATFPVNILASMMGFKPEQGLHVENAESMLNVSPAETNDPQIKLN